MSQSKHRLVGSGVFVALAAVVCLPLTGCGKADKEEAAEVSVQAAAAAQSDISRVVNAEAIIFPIAQSAITPKLNAPVKKFYVMRGQKVQQGQLLAVLENRDLSAAAMDNKGAFEQAEAAYSTNVGATLPEELAKAELDVQTSRQEMDAQQKLYSSREDLFKQGALPRKDLDSAAVALAQARSAYNIAKKHLDGLNAVGKQNALRSASGQLTSAKGKLMNAEAMLSYTEIRSPISGFITDRPLYPGEMASTTAPLLTVMDISQVIAKAHVPQSDVLLLHKGDKATITLAGIEKPLPGKVSLVSPALDPNSTTVEIWVQAVNQDQQLRPGTTAQVAITAQTVKNAVVIPATALVNVKEDAAQVLVLDDQSVVHIRGVKTGIQNGKEAQIVSGLKPGENVVTEGAYGLPDKTKVKVEKPASEAKEEATDKDNEDAKADAKASPARDEKAPPDNADDKKTKPGNSADKKNAGKKG